MNCNLPGCLAPGGCAVLPQAEAGLGVGLAAGQVRSRIRDTGA